MNVVRSVWSLAAVAGLAHVGPYLLSALAYHPSYSRRLQVLAPHVFGLGTPGRLALTFDDGPHPTGTLSILDALDKYGWNATFFMVGEHAALRPDVVREVVARGHEVGLHGHQHQSFLKLTHTQASYDLQQGKAILEDVAEQPVQFFRPPYGSLSGPAITAARSCHLKPVLWSAWGKDWSSDATPESVWNNILRGRLDGGTVLLHDSDSPHSPGNWDAAAGALELLADLVRIQGLTVGPLRNHWLPLSASSALVGAQ